MRISVAQLNYHIGNFEGNLAKMIKAIMTARDQGADLICFSELATCGYPPRDFLEFDDFINQAEKCLDALAQESNDIGIIVGSPSRNPVLEGKDLYNSAYLLYQGEVKNVQHKTLLPTYDIFDEYRYFEPASEYAVVEFKGSRIALTVCEDIWNLPHEYKGVRFENPMYTTTPMDILIEQNPDVIINVSASPFTYKQAETRLSVIKSNVDRYKIPMFYINHVGAQTEVIFDGGSVVMSPDGSYTEMSYFVEEIKIFDLATVENGVTTVSGPKDKITNIHDAIVLGIKDYFGKLNFKTAVLGLSGGIDSAVTAVLAQRALGSQGVRVLLMPSQFSSDHSVEDARKLAENLGIKYDIVPIKGIYDGFMEQLDPLFEGRAFNVTEENIQARIRGVLNMGISNKFGNILLNTSNKSEMAVGYGTLYGDLCGGLSVIGDVYKTDVFRLAEYINKDVEVIPRNTIDKPPSAELRPNQKDSDSLPEYDILDVILEEYIENRKGPNEIISMGYDDTLVRRILRLVNINEFKRYQTAPCLRVSPKAFGMGRRMPIVGKYLS